MSSYAKTLVVSIWVIVQCEQYGDVPRRESVTPVDTLYQCYKDSIVMGADDREPVTSLNPNPQSLTWVIFLHFSFSHFQCSTLFPEPL